MEKIKIVVTREKAESEMRFDLFLSEQIECCSRSRAKTMIDDGLAVVNGKIAKASLKLKENDIVEIEINEPQEIDLSPQNIPIDIVYEDDDIVVVNKQQGLTVHPSETQKDGTLVNALMYHVKNLSGINGEVRPGIVHRIDKNTSGLIVVAKNDKAHCFLSKQLEDKTCYRIYNAIVEGVVKDDEGTVSAPIERSSKDRKMMCVSNGGRSAITHYKVIKRFKNNTFMEFKLETGRTHQIRVHAKYIGHPIVGDDVYGFKKQKFSLQGQLLHARVLSFIHPTTNERVTFEAPLPKCFQKVLDLLSNCFTS